jgi:hypothetical protein
MIIMPSLTGTLTAYRAANIESARASSAAETSIEPFLQLVFIAGVQSSVCIVNSLACSCNVTFNFEYCCTRQKKLEANNQVKQSCSIITYL